MSSQTSRKLLTFNTRLLKALINKDLINDAFNTSDKTVSNYRMIIHISANHCVRSFAHCSAHETGYHFVFAQQIKYQFEQSLRTNSRLSFPQQLMDHLTRQFANQPTQKFAHELMD